MRIRSHPALGDETRALIDAARGGARAERAQPRARPPGRRGQAGGGAGPRARPRVVRARGRRQAHARGGDRDHRGRRGHLRASAPGAAPGSRSTRPRRSRAARPLPPPAERPAPIVAPAPLAPAPAPRRHAHAAAPVDNTSALAQETALLGAANTALAHRDVASALALLDDYDHRARTGILAEERAVTGILTLCAAGRDGRRPRRGATLSGALVAVARSPRAWMARASVRRGPPATPLDRPCHAPRSALASASVVLGAPLARRLRRRQDQVHRQRQVGRPATRRRPRRPRPRLDPFYAQYLDANGIPVARLEPVPPTRPSSRPASPSCTCSTSATTSARR